MKDQVSALKEAGVPAAYLNSSLTLPQQNRVVMNILMGKYKIVYIAPERLELESFQAAARNMNISLITVDEAHCVSQWGHDFRPSYLKISGFIEGLAKRPVVAAFTATATDEVRGDIARILKLQNPLVKVTGFNRENLYFETRRPKDKFAELCSILDDHPNQCAIVYCSTRKTVEEVCERLRERGISATRYHAGLDDKERFDNQEDFIYDRSRIMVATNAFGMGIDKSNVYLIVHYNMPKNIESYYQEAGRAGRDGGAADCILLYSGKDVNTARFFIEHPDDNDEIDENTRKKIMERDYERLKMMTFYSTTNDCLRGFILKYFGEAAPERCENCGNCDKNFEEVDITVDAQKIISCVIRIQRRGRSCGTGMLCDILRGSDNERIERLGLDTISTYGIMRGEKVKRLRDIINVLISRGYLSIDDLNFHVVTTTEKSKLILDGEKLTAMLPKLVEKSEKKLEKRRRVPSELTGKDAELFVRLKDVRAKLAKTRGVPAYIIFPDSALKDMCFKLPVTDEEFLEVSGVGYSKLQRFGKYFMDEIKAFLTAPTGQ